MPDPPPTRGRATNCPSCLQGPLEADRRPRVVERSGRVVVIRQVPVLVCAACGDLFFEAQVVAKLDDEFRRLLAGTADLVISRYIS